MVSAAEWVGIDRLWHACPTCGVQIQKCRSFIAHMHQADRRAAVQHAIASVRF
jgi:predicted RNase H-like nuclease